MVQEGFSNYFAFCGFDDFWFLVLLAQSLKLELKLHLFPILKFQMDYIQNIYLYLQMMNFQNIA